MAKEINFLELELTQRIIEDFPQLITDEEFIEGRAKLAVQTLLSYDKQGYSLDDCLREAHKVLYEGLNYSLFKDYVHLLEEHFPEVPEEEWRPLAVTLMAACKEVTDKYQINDEFDGSAERDVMKNELVEHIRIYIKEHGIQQTDRPDE